MAKKADSAAISPLMQELAGYIAKALRNRLPAAVAEKTRHHTLDTIAAMVSAISCRSPSSGW